MDQFLPTEILVIELLLIATLVAIAVRRLKVPYTVALVLVGLILATQSSVKLTLTPELILALFVPPLVFEAAFHLNFQDLRRALPAILVLAVPGVIISMFLIGGTLSYGIGIGLPAALVFGALIAATDPVAVVALFRLLGVPRQLAILLEGESLFNDGTALVLFNLVLGIALTGKFNFVQSLADFIRVAAGGVMIGLLLGWLVSRLISRIDDYLIETTLTTVLAYGSYLLADQLHFSGVLAVVAAGLINGNLGPQGMSPTTKIVLFNFWEYLAFLVNSMIFLLIGLQVDIPALLGAWQAILWGIGAVMITRFLVVYGLSWILKQFREPVRARWQPVLAWGGLRGALSLALVLSLPESFGDRSLLQAMAFGVVLFTLLVQATSMPRLIRWLGIIVRDPKQIEYEVRQAKLTASRAAEAHMERRYREGLLSGHAWEKMKPRLQEENAAQARNVRSLLQNAPALEDEELENARREILRAKRSAFQGMRRDGVISEEAYTLLNSEIDADLEQAREAPETELESSMEEAGIDGLELQEIIVEPGSGVEGRKIRHVAWPEDFIIARIIRNKRPEFPKGDTEIQAGDILVVAAGKAAFQKALGMCQVEHNAVR